MTDPIDLSVNVPPLGHASQALTLALASIAADPAGCRSIAGYGELGGSPMLREIIGRWVAELRPDQATNPREWVVCDGALSALFLALDHQLKPGDPVLLESPGYPALKDIARALSLEPIPVSVDGQGMLPEALEAAARSSRARCVVMVPSLQNPSGANYTATRRRELAAVCRDQGLLVIEDDIYAGLESDHGHQLTSLHSLMPGQCIYIGGASKTLMPGLRIAWIRPLPGQREALLARLWPRGMGMPQPGHAVFARMVADGQAQVLLEDCRQALRQRNQLAEQILGDRLWQAGSPCSPHRWWPGRLKDSAERHRQVAARGLALAAPDAFTLRPRRDHGLRLCLGAAADLAKLECALTILAETSA